MSAVPIVTSAENVNPLEATVTQKVLVALTGVLLYGFVFVHMVGNFQLYSGPEKLNHYAEFLQNTKPLLWTFRVVILAAVLLHAILAVMLWLRKRAARPVGYVNQKFVTGSLTSRTMIWSGPLIGLFVVYHILNFTTGTFPPPHFDRHNVYNNIVYGFQVPGASIAYILGMVALGFHLYHGSVSLFQTLGLRFPRYEQPLKLVLWAITTIIVVVNISFPLAVLTGLVGLK